MNLRDSEHYEDSHDMIQRIRKLREAAEKKMNAFGDPTEYDVRIIRGRKSDVDERGSVDVTLPVEEGE